MTKAELITYVQNDLANDDGRDVTKGDIEKVLDRAFANISYAIDAAQRFTYPGFGTWTVRTRKARNGVNPQTKAPMRIPAAKKVGFTAAPTLKKRVAR